MLKNEVTINENKIPTIEDDPRPFKKYVMIFPQVIRANPEIKTETMTTPLRKELNTTSLSI